MDHKPRVGVLTFHRCVNYGSYWQARCLLEGLRACGADAELLDYYDPHANFAEARVALRPTLPDRPEPGDYKFYKLKYRRFEEEINRLPRSAQFRLDVPETLSPYDVVVIGSDEVWNLRHPWYAGKSTFFGVGLPAKRIVAYSASFGNYSCWEGIGLPYTEMISGLDAVSVRDENSWWMLKNALALEPPITLDPCLEFPSAILDVPPSGDRTVALVYGHNFSEPFIAKVQDWARRNGKVLASVGYRNRWCDHQFLDAGPYAFAGLAKGAACVVTNFFHGCVFALLNGKPFACEVSDYRSIKVRGLMELLGGQHHLVEGGPLDSLLYEAPSPLIAAKISACRASSLDYLRSALEIPCR